MRHRDLFPNKHTEKCTGCGARRRERHDDECRGHLGTGIRHLDGARRDLRRRFGSAPLAPVESRPGRFFYVTTRSGGHTRWLLGPFVSHMSALAAVPRARATVTALHPEGGAWLAFGTASRPQRCATVFGR